ncbi:helix-turn-helix domain-containing protein [Actinomadura fibrosa]|uniref:Helix-turn-helix domain-containing protein n=1 Tax=Actinomadura fibrosa TaxID=111802 RepID=A0ABW2XIS9_9ACTN|nr:transcriptional regulator [Actinomadura fibrosa]
MALGKRTVGARLREVREAPPYWSRAEMARRLRAAADPRDLPGLPHVASLTDQIKQWESGKWTPSPRYRALYARATGHPEAALFGGHEANVTWELAGTVTDDDEERLTLVAARPARLDASALDALATVLAGQRRLEDVVGPAALLAPVAGQLDAITAMLRGATGPLRDRLGRIVAEWTVYAGWLHAALRQDAKALALFGDGEELADEFDDGTVAAVATSFRGYVARQRSRPRAVVRAAGAAMATPGVHPVQQTYDRLQAAQGLAALGQVDQARRLLDQAAERAADGVEPPPPVYWYSTPFFQLNIGVVHRDLGEYADAAALLDEGLRNIPVDQAGAEWLDEYKTALEDARART